METDPQAVSSDAPQFNALIVEFYMDAVRDDRKSDGWVEEHFDYGTQQLKQIRHQGAGRDIYKDAEFIEIRIPMNLKEVRRRQVRESDKRRWPVQYAAFKAGLASPLIGTPVDKLPFLTKAQVLEFQAMGLRTAENVRDISDSDGQKLMGFQQLRRRVADFLAAAEGNAPLASMRSELESRDAEIAELKKQMAEFVKPEKRK